MCITSYETTGRALLNSTLMLQFSCRFTRTVHVCPFTSLKTVHTMYRRVHMCSTSFYSYIDHAFVIMIWRWLNLVVLFASTCKSTNIRFTSKRYQYNFSFLLFLPILKTEKDLPDVKYLCIISIFKYYFSTSFKHAYSN